MKSTIKMSKPLLERGLVFLLVFTLVGLVTVVVVTPAEAQEQERAFLKTSRVLPLLKFSATPESPRNKH